VPSGARPSCSASTGSCLLVNQAELEGRGGAEHAQGLVRVLHTRELHDDAVHALPGDDRFGDAELVHAVAQRGDVLLDREVLALLDLLRRQSHRDGSPSPRRSVSSVMVDPACAAPRCAFDIVASAQRDAHGIDPTDLDAGKRDALVAQQRAVVALHRAEQLLDRTGDIHLVEEMDAATQVETEAHGFQSHRLIHAGVRGSFASAIRCSRGAASWIASRAASCCSTLTKRRTSRSPSMWPPSGDSPFSAGLP